MSFDLLKKIKVIIPDTDRIIHDELDDIEVLWSNHDDPDSNEDLMYEIKTVIFNGGFHDRAWYYPVKELIVEHYTKENE